MNTITTSSPAAAAGKSREAWQQSSAAAGQRVLLIDATNLVFRCHYAHANNPLINTKGVNVGIPYQFTKTLTQILTLVNPTHCACVFDSGDASATRRKISYWYGARSRRELYFADLF